jgi:two-component system sensor histidine kinase KdpD
MLNLAMGALRRSGPRTEVAVRILATDTGMQFRVDAPGGSLQPGERLNVFEPYGRQLAGAAGYGLGLALARAVVELHEGRIWVEDRQGGGCVFVFELGWPHASARAHRAPQRDDRGGAGELSRTGEPTVET